MSFMCINRVRTLKGESFLPSPYFLASLVLALAFHAQHLFAAPQNAKLQQLDINLLHAESKWALEKSEDHKYELIFALEELTNATCLSQLRVDLDFPGRPQEKQCLKYLNRLAELDPTSPAYLCAHDGFRSSSCQEAYTRQIPVNTNFLYKHGLSKSKAHQGNHLLSKKQTSPLETVEKAYREEKSLDSRKDLVSAYRPLLGSFCHPISLKLVPEKEYISKKQKFGKKKGSSLVDDLKELVDKLPAGKEKGISTPGNDSGPWEKSSKKKPSLSASNSPTGELLAELNSTSPSTSPPMSKERMLRLRILPKSCDALLQRLLSVEPLSSLAICQRDGFYSTHCIEAIRQERQMFQRGTGSQLPGTSQLSTF